MLVLSTAPWKIALALVLVVIILLGAGARAPRRTLPTADLRRLVASALVLYAVGAFAWLTHHLALAVFIYAAGIIVAAFAAWLSRGTDPEDPPDDPPLDEEPPRDPDGLRIDWESFERDLRAYTERARPPDRSRS
jgi:hypothetical protein